MCAVSKVFNLENIDKKKVLFNNYNKINMLVAIVDQETQQLRSTSKNINKDKEII